MNKAGKSVLGIVAGVVMVAGLALAATIEKTYVPGFSVPASVPGMAQAVDRNFAALNSQVSTLGSTAVTNVTGLAAFATNIVAVAPVTNLVVTYTTNIFTYLDANTNAVEATNVFATYSIQVGPAPTLQTRTPALQRQ